MSALHNLQVERGLGAPSKVERAKLKTTHITECVLGYLPKGFVLDGRYKTYIGLYPDKPGWPRPTKRFAGMLYRPSGHVSLLGVGRFDFEAYATSDKADRDGMILRVIERSLIAVARHFGADVRAVRHAVSETLRNNYSCEYETGLSRSTPDRRIRVHVFRRVERRGVSWRIEVRRKDGSLITQRWLRRFAAFNDLRSFYSESRIERGCFILSDYGRDRNRHDLRKYAA